MSKRKRAASASTVPDQVLAAVMAEPWAITQEGLQRVLAVVSRGQAFPDALEARSGVKLENARAVRVRDGVALIPINGPLVTRASFFDDVSGATSYADILRDLTTTAAAPDVHAIVLRIASPGGMVHGCWELARAIRLADAAKPVIAFVEGDACSAAYWIAAACRSIVVTQTACLGCLGVQMAHYDDREYMAAIGVREIVITSSQTPLKNRPPTDDEGRALWQQTADDLAEVFLSAAADFRGVDRGVVDSHFGRGDVLVAARAVSAGLADRVADYETLHAELATGTWPAARAQAEPATPPAAAGLTHSQEQTMPGKPGTATADAGPRSPYAAAFDVNADVRITVTRSIGVNSGDVGTVIEVREGPMYRVQTGDNADVSYAWLGEDELEAAAPADSDAPATDAPPEVTAVRRVQSAIALAHAAGVTAEQRRIREIAALAQKTPVMTLDRLLAMIDDPTMSAEKAALALLGEAPKPGALHLQHLAGDEAVALADKAPKASADAPPPASGTATILAAMRQVNPRALTSTAAHGARPTTGA